MSQMEPSTSRSGRENSNSASNSESRGRPQRSGHFEDARYRSAPFTKTVHMQSLDTTKSQMKQSLGDDHTHSEAFPTRFTYNGWLDVRTNPNKPWKRRYFVLSNNFLLCGTTPYCEKLERVTALEGSTIIMRGKKSNNINNNDAAALNDTSNTSNNTSNSIDSNGKDSNDSKDSKENSKKESKDTTESRSFNLSLRSRKVLYFRAHSSEKCQFWTSHIDRASSLKIKDIYRFLYTLGTSESQMTKVVSAKHRQTQEDCAIKIVDKRSCHQGMLKSEIKILKRLDNPYIVKLYDLFETKKYLYIVMEKCDGGELFDQIADLDGDHYCETDCCRLMYQIAHGVKYMHSMGIVHRDLKPENILCVEPNSIRKIKIADFGISKMVKGDPGNLENATFNTLAGTLNYTAPEILRGKGYNKAVDCWSIGVIMYILLCGYAPFYGETDVELSYEILKSPVPFEDDDWEHVSSNTKDLVKGLLDKDPDERKTLDDIVKLVWQATSAKMPNKMRYKFKNTLVERKKLRMSTPLGMAAGGGYSRSSRTNNNHSSSGSSAHGRHNNNHNNSKYAGKHGNNSGHGSGRGGNGRNGRGGAARGRESDAVSQLTLPWHQRDSMIVKEKK